MGEYEDYDTDTYEFVPRRDRIPTSTSDELHDATAQASSSEDSEQSILDNGIAMTVDEAAAELERVASTILTSQQNRPLSVEGKTLLDKYRQVIHRFVHDYNKQEYMVPARTTNTINVGAIHRRYMPWFEAVKKNDSLWKILDRTYRADYLDVFGKVESWDDPELYKEIIQRQLFLPKMKSGGYMIATWNLLEDPTETVDVEPFGFYAGETES